MTLNWVCECVCALALALPLCIDRHTGTGNTIFNHLKSINRLNRSEMRIEWQIRCKTNKIVNCKLRSTIRYGCTSYCVCVVWCSVNGNIFYICTHLLFISISIAIGSCNFSTIDFSPLLLSLLLFIYCMLLSSLHYIALVSFPFLFFRRRSKRISLRMCGCARVCIWVLYGL